MSYTYSQSLANRSNYGDKRSLNSIKYIVVHYTGNDGDSAIANANYFKSPNRGASAHDFIDDKNVVNTVPHDYVAWSVGGNRYPNCSSTGGGKFYKTATNSNTLNIELCDSKRNGTVQATEETLSNAIEYIKKMMDKYNVPIENVIRHFDVTGKSCPAYFCCSEKNNKAWLDFKSKLVKKDDKKPQNPQDNKVSYQKPSKNNKLPYKVKVKTDVLNIRTGAGTQHKVVGQIKENEVYTIVENKGNWGKLKSGAGWICLDYTVKM